MTKANIIRRPDRAEGGITPKGIQSANLTPTPPKKEG